MRTRFIMWAMLGSFVGASVARAETTNQEGYALKTGVRVSRDGRTSTRFAVLTRTLQGMMGNERFTARTVARFTASNPMVVEHELFPGGSGKGIVVQGKGRGSTGPDGGTFTMKAIVPTNEAGDALRPGLPIWGEFAIPMPGAVVPVEKHVMRITPNRVVDRFQTGSGNFWEATWVRDANTSLWTKRQYQTEEAGRRVSPATRSTSYEGMPMALFPDLFKWPLRPFAAD